MKTKICILIILSLLTISMNTSHVAVTDCSSATTDELIINAGTTTDTGDWDKVVACVAAVQGSAANAITSLSIIIDGDMTNSKSNPMDFGSARFDPSITLTITIANSGLNQAELGTLLYTPLENDKATIGSIILTIDEQPLIADLLLIEGWISGSKFAANSTIKIGGQNCTVADQDALDACLVYTADKAGVAACNTSYLIYKELNLTSDTPSQVNSCLSAIDVSGNGGKLTKLTINYTEVTSISSDNVDFATLFTNRKALITDLSLNLKGTNYKDAPVLTGLVGLVNLTLDYSNNGLAENTTKLLVTDLETAGDLASTTFTVTMSDSDTDNNNFGNVKNLIPLVEISTPTTKTVNVYDRDTNCAFTTSDINSSNSCSIVVITPTISNTTPMACVNKSVNISNNLAEAQNNKVGITLVATTSAWSLDSNISSWTLTATETVDNLATTGVTEQAYALSYSAESISDGTNNIPVIYEDVSFTVGACIAEADMTINNNAPVSDKKYNNCGDLVFGIDQTTITQGAQITEGTTTYSWAFKQQDNSTPQTSADPKNTSTFTIIKSELSTPGTYYVSLTIASPDIIVEDQQIIIESCPATPFINGAALLASYNNCQDLDLSVGVYPQGVSTTQSTQFAWTLQKGSVDVLGTQSPAIPDNTEDIKIPKAALQTGDYDITLTITQPSVRVEDFSVTITDGGNCGTETGADTESSNLLQLSLLMVLVLVSIL